MIDSPVRKQGSGNAPMVEVLGLTKSYGETTKLTPDEEAADPHMAGQPILAIDDVTFQVEAGELFTLLGPSGCGKTTTLRSIAGLEVPEKGSITVGGVAFFDGSRRLNTPVNQRGLGMVFQSYAIWPHMSVHENVAFPLRVIKRKHRLGRKEIAESVERVLAVTGLEGYAARQATKLSGGQQQRLALARALVSSPDVLLLDEPLSNLDAKLRESMRFELKRMQRDLGVTSIYVTHDQTEALALSSRIAVMNGGKVAQVARPRDIYERPADRFVAEFIGTTNLLTGVVESTSADQIVVNATGTTLVLPALDASVKTGDALTVSLRPENVEVSEQQPTTPGVNSLRGTVRTRAFMGDSVEHELVIGNVMIRSKGNPAVSVPEGTEVFITIAPQHLALVANN